jgi:hypothetical protein
MATTAKQLIEYLKTLPDHTTVEVVAVVDLAYGSYGTFETLNLHEYEGNTELIDMRGNQFAKGKPYENDVTLYLGEK